MFRFSLRPIFALVAAISLAACATERQVSPVIESAPRSALQLEEPVFGAVFGGRSTKSDKDTAAQLQSELARLYGPAIEWQDYFGKTPSGRVALRVRIVILGATFGSRLVSNVSFANAVGTAQVNAMGPWGPVAANISSQQSVFSGSITGSGWWNGAAWIDLEVEDLRDATPVRFVLPIVAEHQESNIWGYVSGDKAAQAAWDQASAQLTRAIDSILRSVRD
jgi:hypothetical protein